MRYATFWRAVRLHWAGTCTAVTAAAANCRYNSCQSRHCPTCQTSAKEKWLAQRRTELLPVRYFHVVFTLPHALNGLVDANRRGEPGGNPENRK